jgi:hypothetical protein
MSNDRIILDEILEQTRLVRAPKLSAPIFLELFVSEQVLKDIDLSSDEIQSGLIGDGGDGGIDGFYIFANGDLVRDDFDSSVIRKDPEIEIIFIQTKSATGFAETPVERFLTVSDDIFDLSKSVKEFESVYNTALVDQITRFRNLNRVLASKFPKLVIRYFYVCKGDVDKRELNVSRKGEKLVASVKDKFTNASVDITYLGAAELLALARKSAKTTFSLKLAENPISSTGDVGFVCLVSLRDYHNFICDDRGNLRRHIFEANVRDYQGHNSVNEAIQGTLELQGGEDFWWLNNGVTIVATRASSSAKELTIEDPQIVNGLQTSNEIFNYFRSVNTPSDSRKLLVRVIVPSDGASRDKIIKATNSQTAVQQASLRATDKIHRDIEEYLRPRGVFYDRRKNFYKNEGKPIDAIIGIPVLAQAVMSVLLARPDDARARPSSLLKSDGDYEKIYSSALPINIYFVCADMLRRIDEYFRDIDPPLKTRDRANVRFYVLMYVAYLHVGKWRPNSREIAEIDTSQLASDEFEHALDIVLSKYINLGATDSVAKGSELIRALQEAFSLS